MRNTEITLSDIKDKTIIMKAATRSDVAPRIPKKVPSYFSQETMHREARKQRLAQSKEWREKNQNFHIQPGMMAYTITWEAEAKGPQV